METNTFDVKNLFSILLKRIWVIILILCLALLLGFVYSSKMKTVYCAGTKVYIGDSENIVNSYTDDQMKYYSGFMQTFKEFILIDDFLNDTLASHNIELTAGEIKGGLTFNSATNSPILEMTYTSSNKKQAKEVLTAITSELTDQAKRIIENANVQIVDSVKVVTIKPEKIKVIAISFIVGIIGSMGLVLVLEYLDDRIFDKETLENLLPVPVLGQLPHFSAKEEM